VLYFAAQRRLLELNLANFVPATIHRGHLHHKVLSLDRYSVTPITRPISNINNVTKCAVNEENPSAMSTNGRKKNHQIDAKQNIHKNRSIDPLRFFTNRSILASEDFLHFN
jgi:hypothetical protein